MASVETMRELLEAGVHFGHQTRRWNPRMKPFIFEKRSAIYVINLEETTRLLDEASKFLRSIVHNHGRILFVGCKKQAKEAIKEAAEACNQFYVNERWLGGTLTNLTTIRRSVARMKYIENIENAPEYPKLTKRELSELSRDHDKLARNLDGIRDMNEPPAACVIIDTQREHIAVAEANRLGVPIVALVDTNCNPDLVAHPIPGNDDAIRAIRIILQKLVDAIVEAQDNMVANKDRNIERADMEAVAG